MLGSSTSSSNASSMQTKEERWRGYWPSCVCLAFFQWRNGNEIVLPELEPDTKKQLRKRLAECRVVQHIPAEIAGLSAELRGC
jgi:hypothetical protein